MPRQHLKWERSGRTEVDTDTGQRIWTTRRNARNIDDGAGGYAPYLYDPATGICKYHNHEVEFASDRQILRDGVKDLVSDTRFFVQAEIAGVWTTLPHGAPDRSISELRDKLTVKLDFPAAAYDLQMLLELGGDDQSIFGFRFRPPQASRFRFQWRHRGIKPLDDAPGYKWIESNYDPDKNKPTKNIGIEFADVTWRWKYEEADARTFMFATDPDGSLDFSIMFGPFDLVADELLVVKPDTWGATIIAASQDDCQETGTTVVLAGLDSDGAVLGNRFDVSYLYAARFDGIPAALASATSVDSGTQLSPYCDWHGGTAGGGYAVDALLYGVQEDDPLDWEVGVNPAPSSRTWTTAAVSHSIPASVDGSRFDLDATAAIEELRAEQTWATGNALALVLEDDSNASHKRMQVQTYDNSSINAAELTVVYTPVAVIYRRRHRGFA